MSIYLCYDVKGIQSYIFKIPKLKHIVGGSALRELPKNNLPILLALLSLFAVGGGRNRGLGLVFEALNPVCVPESPIVKNNMISSGFSIPASAVQGAILHRINDISKKAATACFKSRNFRAWPLNPSNSVDALSVRVSFTHKISKLKNENTDNYHFEDATVEAYDWDKVPSNSPLKAADGVLLTEGTSVKLWKPSDMARVITAHGVHNGDRVGIKGTQKRNLFTVESLAPTLFIGEGAESDLETGSFVQVADAVIHCSSINERTHNLINRHTGAVVKGGLFSLEAVPPMALASLSITLKSGAGEPEEYAAFICDIIGVIGNDPIVGGNSNRGIGRMKVVDGVYLRTFDLDSVDGVADFMDAEYNEREKGVELAGVKQEIPETGDKLTLSVELGIPRGEDVLVGDGGEFFVHGWHGLPFGTGMGSATLLNSGTTCMRERIQRSINPILRAGGLLRRKIAPGTRKTQDCSMTPFLIFSAACTKKAAFILPMLFPRCRQRIRMSRVACMWLLTVFQGVQMMERFSTIRCLQENI